MDLAGVIRYWSFVSKIILNFNSITGSHKLFLPNIFLLISFFVNLGLGFLVYAKNRPHTQINLVFSVLAWSSAGWVLSVFMIHYFRATPSMLFWGKMSFATSSIIP